MFIVHRRVDGSSRRDCSVPASEPPLRHLVKFIQAFIHSSHIGLEQEQIQRDKSSTFSFWLWLNIFAGLVSSDHVMFKFKCKKWVKCAAKLLIKSTLQAKILRSFALMTSLFELRHSTLDNWAAVFTMMVANPLHIFVQHNMTR